MISTKAEAAFRNTTYKRVTITEVNPAARYIEGIDQVGSPFRIEWFSHPSVVLVPKVQEDWVITHVNNVWKLLWKYEDFALDWNVAELKAGDLRLQGDRVVLNGSFYVQNFPNVFKETNYGEVPAGLIDGVNKVFITSRKFLSGSLRVYVNGLRTINFSQIENVAFELIEAPLLNDAVFVDYDYDILDITQESQLGHGEG